MRNKGKILILSTGDATRSHMAHGFLQKLCGDQFQIVSAGVETDAFHPSATEAMMEAGIDTSRQKSASVAESLRNSFAYAIMIYDQRKERSPIFPFTLKLLRWSIADPCGIVGTPAEQQQAFRIARDQIQAEVRRLVAEIGQTRSERGRIAA
jgi:arsenate reductase (thioredoxin)